MKKYLFTLMTGMLLVFAMGSCDNRTQLEIDIEEANAELPEDMGDGMVMTHCELVGNSVIYTIECDENEIVIEALKEAKAEMYEAMVQSLKEETDKDVKELYRLMKEENIDMKFKYVSKQSRDELIITIPAMNIPY